MSIQKTKTYNDLLKELENLNNEMNNLRALNKVLVGKIKEKEIEIVSLNKQLVKEKENELENATTRRFNMVTILYSSVKGFSHLTEQANAYNWVDELDKLYYMFDTVVKSLNIKKVKSIGDTYMCAGGIPRKNRTNAVEVILAALQIQAFMAESHNKDSNPWNLSLGIHTGSVTASISGKKKISYELKGDSANIVSRIEAAANLGTVTISAMTYEFVRDFFDCEYVGSLPVKYLGDIAMYEVKGLKDKFTDDPAKIHPNKAFHIRFGHVRYDDIEEYILNRLEKELPKHLYYHNVKHTMDVCIGVEIIGTAEGVTEEELLYLKTAALFHDMGQIVQSKGHEEISCKFAREILPQYHYTSEQIDIICEIIMATQLPPKPQNLLQRIICDADLDYLGRTDFIPVSDTLYKELSVQNIITDKDTWNKLQVSFISNHQYFTEFAKNNREVNKQNQIERLKKLLSVE